MNILSLPNVMLIEIFEFLSYDEVSKKRVVCRRFDQIAQQVLNCGFNKVVKQHNVVYKRIKSLLPRRESERRNHCLARHADILTSVETRISMLTMTYTKFMDLSLCCFIPGRVLDEIFRVLRLVTKTSKPLRPHEVLQELRDISSMAIEHFDEKILKTMRKKIYGDNFDDSVSVAAKSGLGSISFSGMETSASTSFYDNTLYNLVPFKKRLSVFGERCDKNSKKTTLNSSEPPQTSLPSTSKATLEHQHPDRCCAEAQLAMNYVKKLESEYKKSITKMHRMQQIQNFQGKRLQQTLSHIAELGVQNVELKKRLEDIDAKNREISANIRHISGGEATKNDEINQTTTSKDEINDDEIGILLPCPSTSRSLDNTLATNLNKRQIVGEGELPFNQAEDDCEPQLKKQKFKS